MKKVFLLTLVFLMVFISEVRAYTSLPYDSSMVYNVTVNKVEVYNSTTGQWVTVTSTATTFNIASATAVSTAVGNMISGVSLPNGTYTRFKWEVSSTFGIKACNTAAGVCTNGTQQAAGAAQIFSAVAALTYATASTTSAIFDFTNGPDAACPANTATVTYTCTATSLAGDAAITSFVIGAGSTAKTANITIDVGNVMRHYSAGEINAAAVITPGLPTISVTFE